MPVYWLLGLLENRSLIFLIKNSPDQVEGYLDYLQPHGENTRFKKKENIRDDGRKRDWVADRFKPRQQVNHLSNNPLELHDSDEEAWER
jgi:hypothetical protein